MPDSNLGAVPIIIHPAPLITLFYTGGVRHRDVGELTQSLVISKQKRWHFLPESLSPESRPIRSGPQPSWEVRKAGPVCFTEPCSLCAAVVPPARTVGPPTWSFPYEICPFVYSKFPAFSHGRVPLPKFSFSRKGRHEREPYSLHRVELRYRREKDSDGMNSPWVRKVRSKLIFVLTKGTMISKLNFNL